MKRCTPSEVQAIEIMAEAIAHRLDPEDKLVPPGVDALPLRFLCAAAEALKALKASNYRITKIEIVS